MLREHTKGERVDQIAAIRHDEGLTDLLRIHLAGPVARQLAGESAPRLLNPALLGGYLELDSIRYDYPVVLVEGQAEISVVPLASIIDAALEKTTVTGPQAESLRRYAYRLERLIKPLAKSRPRRRLSELWVAAAVRLEKQSKNPNRVWVDLEAMRTSLGQDGPLLFCDARTPRRLFEHVWRPLQSIRADGERVVIEELIARLSEVLESERARSPKSTSPEALEAGLGGEHAGGIDFQKLSTLLRSTGDTRIVPAKRMKRLRLARKVLESERALLPSAKGNGKRRRRDRSRAATCSSCAQALELFDTELKRRVDLLRAIRVANLELENRYREDRHDRFFETFGAEQLTPGEYKALPPLLVFLSSESFSDKEKSILIDILGSDMPVKVVLEVHELTAADSSSAPPGAFTEWVRQIARMAVSMGEAFVMQTAASHLPQLMPQIVAGLEHQGPSLFCVYSGPNELSAAVPHYLYCASAIESRAFPSFVYDPGRGADYASRFSLEGSPQVDRDWPEHSFAYETNEGEDASENLHFTCVDFLMLDPRFSHHFVVVPRSRWHANMVPMASYLALSPKQALDKVPFVYQIDDEDRVHRVVVRRALVAFARKCLANWKSLQELAGINDPRVQRLLDEQRTRLEEEHQRAIEALEATQPAQTETPIAESTAAEAEPTEQVDEVETATVSPPTDQAYIDTELCTTCDDCIERNSAMFAYNDEKQAYIKDLTAGTYRDLVEAAENCPVCIIHPGQPVDSGEAGLEELKKRAVEFN